MRMNNSSLIIFDEVISHNLFGLVWYVRNLLNEKKMIKFENNDTKSFELNWK